MTLTKQLLITSIIAILISACSAITDFSEDSDKIDLDNELKDIISVTIDNSLGTIDLVFKSSLPENDADAIYDLIGHEIKLQVINNENNVGIDLTEKPSESAPKTAGEYTVTVSDDNKTATIIFYNETSGGYTLNPGGDYSALLHISENDFFETDDCTFEVNVK